MRPAGLPYGSCGELTPTERFLWESSGFLVIEDALSPEEVHDCLAACERAHADLRFIQQHTVPVPEQQPTAVVDEWRQLGCAYEFDPALERLMDHPSVFSKIAPLLGEHFSLHSSWCTMVPAGSPGGGVHQDASGPSAFRLMGTPAPLVQVRVGFVLTDLSEPNRGNLVVVPGSHNASVPLPPAATDYSGTGGEQHPVSSAIPLCARAGTAILFHQGLWHTGGPNIQVHRFERTNPQDYTGYLPLECCT